jgi:ATP-dependent helicase HrpB
VLAGSGNDDLHGSGFSGDALAAMPGVGEERGSRLKPLPEGLLPPRSSSGAVEHVEIVMLHGDLALAAQQAALAPAATGTRRVVLATNVAESSVTLPGVTAVVDGGLAREPRFDPGSGFTRLETVRIARSSADQRAGRAGRVAPGTCWRLWPQSLRLEASRTPEIAQVELSQLALELAAWGSQDLSWLDAPPAGALAQARELLGALGALDATGAITERGRAMLALGAQPRLAAAVLAPRGAAQRRLACEAAALVEARNPLRGDAARSDDFRLRLAALHAFRHGNHGAAAGADRGALAAIARAADAWLRRRDSGGAEAVPESATALGDVLIHAFPDRIAHRDPAQPRRYRLANGRGARLADDSALVGEPWLVAIDLRHDARDSRILAAVPFDPDRLEEEFPGRFARERVQRWNAANGRVEAFEETRFGAIVLARRSVATNPDDALPALLAAVRDGGLDRLPWSDAARVLRRRIESLREWCPELGLPDVSDAALLAALDDWLAPALAGRTRLDALRAEDLSHALSMRLDPAQRRALDEHAPTHVRVPSGQQRAIAYAPGEPPVLAVRLQELFGLGATPRIAKGRVPLTLHLLSPAGRPIQVTTDLDGFWRRTYPEVKKELKGRYPRHPWPDDPWSATPTHRARPRSR